MKYFTVIGSKILRQNSKYHVSVSAHGYEQPQKLEISIKGEEKNFEGHPKIVTLSGNNAEILEYDFVNQPVGNYFLVAKAIDGDKFERKVNLHMNFKRFSVFVQTDKSIYKPSENVQFRVLLLDIDTKPYESKNVQIFITDGADNRVKQFSDPKFTKGVFEGELQLSDSPVMGNWMIHVKVDNGDDVTKEFEVAEYVLPKFEVIVEANPHVTFAQGKIHATVSGKYTFGKLAKGKAKVSAQIVRNIFSHRMPSEVNEQKVEKIVDVDGKKDIKFDIKDELKITQIDDDEEVQIKATFVEELSGKEHSGTTKVTIHKTEHKIDLVKSNEKIKPGLPYSVTAFVKTHNGAPVMSDVENPVEFAITYYREARQNPQDDCVSFRRGYYGNQQEEKERRFERVFLADGAAELAIEVPKNVTRVELDINYLKTHGRTHNIAKIDSETGNFLQFKISPKNPKIGDEVSVIVEATDVVQNLTYIVVGGREEIVLSKNVKIPNSRNFDFSFPSSTAMMPTAKLLVYYIRDDGEIISDQVKINFGYKLKNLVTVDLSAEQSKPGELINLTVNADANSYVGLLGVDQSVLLLKTGNDIQNSDVVIEAGKYNFIEHYNTFYDEFSHRFQYQNFESMDVVVITNAKEENLNSRYRMMDCCRMSSAPRAMAMSFGSKQSAPMDFDESESFCDMVMPKSGGAGPEPPKVVMRQKFPETFIFESLDLSKGKNVLSKIVPDTITSWIITAFAVDPATGLGLIEHPKKLNVFQPFFVSTNLPYSIKRGEVVSIPIIVFNYMDQDQQVDVTLFNDDNEFEFMEKEKLDNKTKMTKFVAVKSNDGTSVNFTVKPLKAGNIKIKVTATSGVAGDGLEQMLIVESEGVTQYMNKALFIDLRNVKEFKTNFSIEIPENAVPDSTKIEVSAIGDILGPSIDNLDKLIRIPYGCGEQNMLNFVPNIIILEYLSILGKLTPEIALKAKKYMETGYQRELTYKHHDGSYSAFGRSDKCGSTWLTAFVAKSFHQASKHIQTEPENIKQALNFLSKAQAEDGSFKENGTVFHTDMQGGSSKGLGLTAYVLITFLENENEMATYQSTIKKALDFIITNSKELDDNYSLAITAYAMQLAKHTLKDSLLENLNNKADNLNGLKHWTKSATKTKEEKSWNQKPNAINIEMTAYVLQAFIEAGMETESVPILKWLVTQRNENGGFQSTQDTVVGLQSLSKLAAKMYVADSQVDITLKHDKGSPSTLSVNSENALVLQKHELPSNVRDFEISASGKGFSVLQISYKFNITENGNSPRFILEPKLKEKSNKNSLHLTVSTNYLADVSSQKSNMAVMEVSFPSGYIFDSDHLAILKAVPKVKRVETKDGETVVVVYFDDIDTKQISLDFKAVRAHDVAELKPAPVLIYDYYDNSRRASTFYTAPEVILQEIAA